VLWIAALVTAAAAAWFVRRRRREIRLLREGEVTMGFVQARDNDPESNDRVFFRFTAADGTPVSARGWDLRYKVGVGASVPVFYDVRDPKDCLIACGSWFEADQRDENGERP
jgi:hypothetical protein